MPVNNDKEQSENTLTEEEQAFIDGVEFAIDYHIPIPPEEYERYLELTEKRAKL